MKKLIIYMLLILSISANGQLRKQDTHMMPPDMFKPTGQTIEPKFAAVILVETGLLLASSYFIAQNNQKAYRVARNAFLISTVPVFCLTLSLDKPKRKKFR